ncbi:hypothetical protein D3C72_2524150 [compost metagenome]
MECRQVPRELPHQALAYRRNLFMSTRQSLIQQRQSSGLTLQHLREFFAQGNQGVALRAQFGE